MLELKTLKTLVPQKARAWFIREGYLLDLYTGLAESLKEVRLWFELLLENIFPDTADISLEDWFHEYEIIYNSLETLETKRNKLKSKVYQSGASNKDYIISILRKAGLNNVFIKEGIVDEINSCGDAECGEAECDGLFTQWDIYDDYYNYYLVYGTVGVPDEINTLKAILFEIVSVRLKPIYYLNYWVIEDGFWRDGKFWMDTRIWKDVP